MKKLNLVSFQGFMTGVSSKEVKQLIEALQKHHSIKEADGTEKPASLRDLETIYGVLHQTLSNWKKGAKKHNQLFEFIERARKVLGIKEGRAYRMSVKPRK